jgi:geranylgeranyl reductase family protein
MTVDVLIVGAGPAGTSSAIALAQRGVRRVLLLDRTTFPREKTCGSGLSPNAIALAEELGIGDELRSQAIPIRSVKIVTPGGRTMVLSSNASAVVLLRRTFDNLLLERAQALGVAFEGGVRVSSLVREAGRVVGVRMADGRDLRARFVLCADGAHSIFSTDPRPKRSISTLMGWWDGADFEEGRIEMVFDRNVAPLYGWLFPEGGPRVNIGICIEGPAEGARADRNVRDVFARFLADHYAARLRHATPVGKLKGHPIVYTTWVAHNTTPGALYVGEAARMTHNATGEGISQAMQCGIYAANAVSDVIDRRMTEEAAWRAYVWSHRRRFTAGFLAGHALRAVVRSPVLDGIAALYNQPAIRRSVVRVLGSALAGSSVRDAA